MVTETALRRLFAALSLGPAALAVAGASASLAYSGASPATMLYERSVMAEADQRCRLFAPEISAALNAARLQARGAALRSGAPAPSLDATERRAALTAYGTACTSHDMAVAADRVRSAFAGYARVTAMEFPGDNGLWRADRRPSAPVVDHKAVDGPRWRLVEAGAGQTAADGATMLGLGGGDALLVMAAAPELRRAATAFLIVRDPAKAALPYLDPRRRSLADRTPPRIVCRAFVAEDRRDAPPSLLPRGRGDGVLFAFPAAAADALAALDPRETVTIEFSLPGEPPRRALFEAGDFAAARAFLAVRPAGSMAAALRR